MNRDKFDKEFEKTEKYMKIYMVIISILALSGAGFGVWIILTLMSYFGVI